VLKLAIVNLNPFKEGRVGHGWFDSFFGRHPRLRSVVGSRVERLHASGANADVIGRFFYLLENLLEVLLSFSSLLSLFLLLSFPDNSSHLISRSTRT
jgi:hypothetical protein